LEGCIFIGCRAHLQGGGLRCISSNAIVMHCDFIRNVCGGATPNHDGIPLAGPHDYPGARNWKRR
jgi:hypothetical protein